MLSWKANRKFKRYTDIAFVFFFVCGGGRGRLLIKMITSPAMYAHVSPLGTFPICNKHRRSEYLYDSAQTSKEMTVKR